MTRPVIVDGNALAARIKDQTAVQVRDLAGQGVRVTLDAIMVGEGSTGEIYARSQQKHCHGVGIEYRMHAFGADATEAAVRDRIRRLNEDAEVTGILLNLPLPRGMDTPALQYHIDPYKDVEGVNPANIGLLFYDTPIIAPCTALAVMEMLREARCEVRGRSAVVVGQGPIVGKPISLFLLHELATVTCCHVATRDLPARTREAEILVVAVGKPGLITAAHVCEGAVVIDVGINRVTGPDGRSRVVGDVVFEEVAPKCSVITPVPGGIGPVTVAMLLRSATEAARQQRMFPRRLSGQ
jgi:methylenetetrahydrofolate dehydrogenase (NADP+)/methenyltetrahydrofolate cyclohydrolase